MKRKTSCKPIFGLASFVLASLVLINAAHADGTEQLGPPSIDIAQGSQMLIAGTGLNDAQPGEISIEIPSGVTIAQVLLYWSGRATVDPGTNDTIEVEGTSVTGQRIGGPTTESGKFPSSAYRADITELSAAESWILASQVNVLSVQGLDFDYSNDGAAVVVILDDGSTADIQIRDGNDWAWLPEGAQTKPVEFPVAPSADPQIGYLWLIVTDINVPRPAAVEIVVDGVTNLLDNVLQDNEGAYLDVVELAVPVPAAASNVTVRLLSIDDGSELRPASLAWIFVAWELREPPVDEGCTYTIGYWKNHPEDWPTNTLSIFSGDDAMDILWTPSKGGNAYLILAHQYIGAELNVVNGTSIPDEVGIAWLDGQALLLKYESEGNIPKNSPDRALAIAIAGVLDDYNNGYIGPGHCCD